MRIKELIKEKGYTQKEFAEKLGMSTVGLSQILAGKPSYTTMEKIAKNLDVPIWQLFIDKEDLDVMYAPLETPAYVCPHCGKPIKLTVKIENDVR
jgi:transcriptional regulator with XRE-family HTH domain